MEGASDRIRQHGRGSLRLRGPLRHPDGQGVPDVDGGVGTAEGIAARTGAPPHPGGLTAPGPVAGHGPATGGRTVRQPRPVAIRTTVRSNAKAVEHDSGTACPSTSTVTDASSGVLVPRVTV